MTCMFTWECTAHLKVLGMLSVHWVDESLVDVWMEICFYKTTLYVQVEHNFYMLNCVILGAFTKLWKATISFVISVCLPVYLSVRSSVFPHGTTRLPLVGFLWYLIFKYFSKIYRENSSIIKIWEDNEYFSWRTM